MEHAIPEKFPCFRCGACCLDVSGVEEISSWATRDGACRYYDAEKHECTIYDRRPTVCNVWKTYRQSYEKQNVSWDDFVYTNMLNCCLLRYLHGVEEPEGSPFEGIQEDIASALLHDMKSPRMDVPLLSREDEPADDAASLSSMYALSGRDDDVEDQKSSPSKPVPELAKTENNVPSPVPAISPSGREKISRPAPEIPLEEQSIDLDVPDVGLLPVKNQVPKSTNRHRGELL